jgi:hypothetical protein
MKKTIRFLIVAFVCLLAGDSFAQSKKPGGEEFGLTQKELVQSIDKVESLIAKCMRKQGFEYVPADFKTVRRGMTTEKSIPGMSEDEFVEQYGFGISTRYTGQPPQLAEKYSPARVALGERNIEIFKKLSPADQAAYTRALSGNNADATFAMSLEAENFSRCGGCTLDAIKQAFKPEELTVTYYNPKDAIVNKDPRMKAALRTYTEKMRAAGFDYNHPDEVEGDVRKRLDAILGGETPPVENLSTEQRAALKSCRNTNAAWRRPI